VRAQVAVAGEDEELQWLEDDEPPLDVDASRWQSLAAPAGLREAMQLCAGGVGVEEEARLEAQAIPLRLRGEGYDAMLFEDAEGEETAPSKADELRVLRSKGLRGSGASEARTAQQRQHHAAAVAAPAPAAPVGTVAEFRQAGLDLVEGRCAV
jgi:hypothetical protein